MQGRKVLIVTHNNPDSDAIASGWALSFLLKEKFKINAVLAYGGLITRAENRAMTRLLNINIKPLETINVDNFSVVALVDTEPGAGNNSLPLSITPAIVIDHHKLSKSTQGVDFVDVRPNWGSSATILTKYLTQAGVSIGKKMATALYYGIKTDTQNLGRDAAEPDYKAVIMLYPKVQLRRLSRIEFPELSRNYFLDFDKALHKARTYGDLIVCGLGSGINPDMAAFISDLLMRISGVRWSLAMGIDDARLIFSLRTRRLNQNAGLLAQELVKGSGSAGGHGMTAGGQIFTRKFSKVEKKRMSEALRKQFVKTVSQTNIRGKQLVPQKRVY